MTDPRHKSTDKIVRLTGRLLWEIVSVVLPAVIFALVINVHIASAVLIEDGPSM